jgi:hypothetical protein
MSYAQTISVAALSLALVASAHAADSKRLPTTTPPPTGPGGITGPLPDLRPIPSRAAEHGTISIKNFGPGNAAASIATLVCQKVGVRGPGGHCPDPGRIPQYEDAAYPNAVVVHVPPIAAGHVYSVKLTFWDKLVWTSGSYTFTETADAGATVAETNEGNNVGDAVKVVP